LEAPEIKCRFSWSRKQIELFIKGYEARIPAFKLSEKLTPKDMIDQAVLYAVWADTKQPGVSTQIIYREGPLKMAYYNARKAHEQCFRPTPNVLYTNTKTGRGFGHVCELKGGTEHTGGLESKDGIPHILGELSAWKSWDWDPQIQRLRSPSREDFIWEPLQVVEARCRQCPAPPCTKCTCGIYAGTEVQANPYGEVLGILKQWGRFVQGGTGVKSQYAYPQEFWLKAGQELLIESLQQYGVPIKMMMPTIVWDPRENGFITSQGDTTL
jgi:hypothetical protein